MRWPYLTDDAGWEIWPGAIRQLCEETFSTTREGEMSAETFENYRERARNVYATIGEFNNPEDRQEQLLTTIALALLALLEKD